MSWVMRLWDDVGFKNGREFPVEVNLISPGADNPTRKTSLNMQDACDYINLLEQQLRLIAVSWEQVKVAGNQAVFTIELHNQHIERVEEILNTDVWNRLQSLRKLKGVINGKATNL